MDIVYIGHAIANEIPPLYCAGGHAHARVVKFPHKFQLVVTKMHSLFHFIAVNLVK